MKIGIDIRYLSIFTNKAGIYQYVYNLVSNLPLVDSHNEYTLLSTLRGFRGDRKIASQFLRRFPGRVSDLLLERLSIPIEFFMGMMDVFHGPCYFIPRCLRCKSIVTIHDIMTLRSPEFLKPETVNYYNKKIQASARRADAIIAVSNFTKEEIVDVLNIPDERVRVIYNGVSPVFHPVKERIKIEDVKAKYGIKGNYLLFVGNIEPKKNIVTLIHACIALWNSTIYKYPLLIVGSKTCHLWHFEAVWKVVQQFHAEKDIIFADVVTNEDLPLLYSGAELFIFPSLFEGFGIPVIEAMACGTPVVASNRTSIPEIAGGAALLVDPLNVNEITEAMHRVLSNSQLREHLVEKGLEWVKNFSWEQTARETLKLYQEVS